MATFHRTLTREQRDQLWEQARYDFEPSTEFELGREEILEAVQTIEDTIRLYDDLGWEEVDPRTSYTLTMPDEQLERIIGRLTHDACGVIHDQLDHPWCRAPDYPERDIAFLHTCLAIEGKVAEGVAF